MHRSFVAVITAAVLFPAALSSQTVVAAAQPQAPPGAVAISLPEGTAFVVRTKQAVSSRTSADGDEVPMEVSEDVVVNGYTMIRAGAIVRASVTDAHRAGRVGRGGSLSINVESTSAVDQQRVHLRSAKTKEGSNATGSTVALTVLFGPLGLLKRGHEATYNAGTPITVYTDAPFTVFFAQQPAAPVVVQQTLAPAPVLVQQPAPAPVVQPQLVSPPSPPHP